MFNKETNKSLQ